MYVIDCVLCELEMVFGFFGEGDVGGDVVLDYCVFWCGFGNGIEVYLVVFVIWRLERCVELLGGKGGCGLVEGVVEGVCLIVWKKGEEVCRVLCEFGCG